MGLNPEAARRALEVAAVNAARKVADGKSLTPTEARILEKFSGPAVPSGPEPRAFVRTQVELADELNVNRKTVQRWMKVKGNPGSAADGRYSVSAWRDWARENGHRAGDALDKGELQTENLLLQNQKLAFTLEVMRKEYIPRRVARQVFTMLIFAAKTRGFSGVSRMATLVRMAKDMPDAVEVVKREMEEIWQPLTSSEWFQPDKLSDPTPSTTSG